MPRYHFNVYNGRSSIDLEGTDLPNRQQAQREAIRLAGALLCEEADTLTPDDDWRLEVTDASGLILFRFDFSFQKAQATL
ncbi:DUF6894 family protein [Methylobacterium trifolii]|uniref:DUF6894 family protein n=1 Tax=Methylobacterium trifolii TaxID=1003092 RepID=UPI0035A24363